MQFKNLKFLAQRYWLVAIMALLSSPQVAWAQDGGEAAGGILKTMIGYTLVLVGVGLGIAAVAYPSGKSSKPAKK